MSGWVKGKVDFNGDEYDYQAKVFDDPSLYGIEEGRVSKLKIDNEDGFCIARYDRRWEVSPESKDDKKVLKRVMRRL